jgi:hypothetical protein
MPQRYWSLPEKGIVFSRYNVAVRVTEARCFDLNQNLVLLWRRHWDVNKFESLGAIGKAKGLHRGNVLLITASKQC